MKKMLVFLMTMALGVSATAFAANPFSDVPQEHWAYTAVAELAASGVATGLSDGTFKGNATMTRYEMAQIVAKALAKGSINENDALVIEFASELENLGVRVAKLEKEVDNVKISGSLRYRYYDYSASRAKEEWGIVQSYLRSRVGIVGRINDDWTYNALVENRKNFIYEINNNDDETKVRRAWLEGKVGKTKLTLGRFNYISQTNNGVISEASNVFEQELDGVKAKFNIGACDFDLVYGRKGSIYNIDNKSGDLFIATIGSKIGVVDTSLGYYNEQSNNILDDISITTLGLSSEIIPDITLSGMAIKGDKRAKGLDEFGYVLGLQYKKIDKSVVGSYNLYANYYDQPLSTYIMPSIAYATDLEVFELGNLPYESEALYASELDGLKMYKMGIDYTLSKNMVASLYYFDLKTRKVDSDMKLKIIVSQMKVYF